MLASVEWHSSWLLVFFIIIGRLWYVYNSVIFTFKFHSVLVSGSVLKHFLLIKVVCVCCVRISKEVCKGVCSMWGSNGNLWWASSGPQHTERCGSVTEECLLHACCTRSCWGKELQQYEMFIHMYAVKPAYVKIPRDMYIIPFWMNFHLTQAHTSR